MAAVLTEKQKVYVADCLKIVGAGQLAGLGIKELSDEGSVGIPLLIVSLGIWILLVLLGIEMLREE